MANDRQKKDPQSEQTGQGSGRLPEEVEQNQPGSKGDGSTYRAGEGNPGSNEGDDGDAIEQSRDQQPNRSQTNTQATMAPDGDLGHKRNTM